MASGGVHCYEAPWHLFSLGWSLRPGDLHLAVGSFIGEYANKIRLLTFDRETGAITPELDIDHHYPTTALGFMPVAQSVGDRIDLLASTGDYLRLHEIVAAPPSTPNTVGALPSQPSVMVRSSTRLDNNKTAEYCAPLTSLAWAPSDPVRIATGSVDTTLSVWDAERRTLITQLIAHDKEVFDVEFAPDDANVFCSVGSDGTARLFDLRALNHSTICHAGTQPLSRLAWCPGDPNLIALQALSGTEVVIIDRRAPSVPYALLRGHAGPVNAVTWSPHSSTHIATAAEDQMAVIWDLRIANTSRPGPCTLQEPLLAYKAAAELNVLKWSPDPMWLAAGHGNQLELLHV
eukprot:gnl/Ergobibamus_cyprinoides/428.p1 GENE.gnl/Ergobibamus_cyprinoides/428~~gnl/Ergobibamus_cyprinoides/428.p1  ORF type:complete len:362 (+),score=69.89 gnl/Ergobibamus_cyprinoides/428:47-1087(+)